MGNVLIVYLLFQLLYVPYFSWKKHSNCNSFYIFSDGFVDQFGGEKGKKFKIQPFRDLLLSVQENNMYDQKTMIYKTFEDWKGDLEQIDDICVIGVRI